MLLWVKKVDEPWNDATRKRLSNLGPLASNFDGHTLEFHRKLLEQRRESDKVLIYYTDGDMPAANYTEELEILQREINTCKQKKISLLAVGINTMSPQDHGFDTVRVDSDEDINKVVAQLERRLTASR
jgi:cobalamin biosynthesis protein CobT